MEIAFERRKKLIEKSILAATLFKAPAKYVLFFLTLRALRLTEELKIKQRLPFFRFQALRLNSFTANSSLYYFVSPLLFLGSLSGAWASCTIARLVYYYPFEKTSFLLPKTRKQLLTFLDVFHKRNKQIFVHFLLNE